MYTCTQDYGSIQIDCYYSFSKYLMKDKSKRSKSPISFLVAIGFFFLSFCIVVLVIIFVNVDAPGKRCDPFVLIEKHSIQLESNNISWALKPYNPDEGIIFLKTHKTASSTLTSILWANLCESNLKDCFLPPFHHPGKTWDFRRSKDWTMLREHGGSSLQRNTSGCTFDVWVFHAAYCYQLHRIVPNTQRMISIVRRPSSRFQSAWHWYNHSSTLHVKLSQYASLVSKYNSSDETKRLVDRMPRLKYRSGLDATTEELTGQAEFRLKDSRTQLRAYDGLLQRITSQRLVLLVADRFDESLLVLGRLMRWNLTQLAYFKHKVGEYEYVSESTAMQLDTLQPFDLALWQYADKVLSKYIESSFTPSDFATQLAALQKMTKEVARSCLVDHDGSRCVCHRTRDNNEAIKARWTMRGQSHCVGVRDQDVKL